RERDMSVVPGDWGHYRPNHPTGPARAVEIAGTSLAFGRREKASLYARGGIRDYWVVNLVDRELEVFRDPEPDETAAYGWNYRTIEQFAPGAVVSLLALPSVQLRGSDLIAAVPTTAVRSPDDRARVKHTRTLT